MKVALDRECAPNLNDVTIGKFKAPIAGVPDGMEVTGGMLISPSYAESGE